MGGFTVRKEGLERSNIDMKGFMDRGEGEQHSRPRLSSHGVSWWMNLPWE